MPGLHRQLLSPSLHVAMMRCGLLSVTPPQVIPISCMTLLSAQRGCLKSGSTSIWAACLKQWHV